VFPSRPSRRSLLQIPAPFPLSPHPLTATSREKCVTSSPSFFSRFRLNPCCRLQVGAVPQHVVDSTPSPSFPSNRISQIFPSPEKIGMPVLIVISIPFWWSFPAAIFSHFPFFAVHCSRGPRSVAKSTTGCPYLTFVVCLFSSLSFFLLNVALRIICAGLPFCYSLPKLHH